MQVKSILKTARPSFLLLTPICVFLGLSTAYSVQNSVDLLILALVFIGALSAHISVNMLNEYFDFKSGLDFETDKTSFSGGSGALPENPKIEKAVLSFGLFFLFVTEAIGVYFVVELGLKILPIGIVGVLLVFTYTKWLNRYPLLCLVSPGLGFGLLMVVGTSVVLTGEYSMQVFLISLIPFFLVNNLLLLNQYPDIKADEGIGRKTYPIIFGIEKSNQMYFYFMMATYLLIILFVALGIVPLIALIALVPMALSLFALHGAVKMKAKIGETPQYLAANVAATLLTPLLLALTLFIGFNF